MLRDDIQPYLDQLRARKLTNRALAKALQVSETHLCRVLKQLGFAKDAPPSRDNKRILLAERKAFRVEQANTLSITEAARVANCSTRTIYRLRKKNGA